jgi:hypothetical protein
VTLGPLSSGVVTELYGCVDHLKSGTLFTLGLQRGVAMLTRMSRNQVVFAGANSNLSQRSGQLNAFTPQQLGVIALNPTVYLLHRIKSAIGTNLPIRNVRCMAAFGGADIKPASPDDRVWTQLGPRPPKGVYRAGTPQLGDRTAW